MKLRYSIGIATKMIFIVTLIVVGAIGVVVYIATDLFREDSVTKVQETNKDTAAQLAERVHTVFSDGVEKMTLLAQFATRSESIEEAQRAIENTLKGSDDLISFVAYRFNQKGEAEIQFQAASESALAEFNLDEEKLKTTVHEQVLARHQAKPDELILLNSSPLYGVPLFTVSFLSKADKGSEGLAGRWWFRSEFRQDRILKLFDSKKFVNSYLVDASGKLMAHSDPAMAPSVIQGVSFAANPMVERMTTSETDNHQMSYQKEDGEVFLAAFKKVGVSGIGVVAEVAEAKALATIERVQYRSLLVMLVVVGAAFLLNFGFSQSLTSNLKRLFSATELLVEGKYDVDLKIQSSDEIGALGQAFLKMAGGLKEREKMKDVLDKFHSKEIAKKLLSGEIKLGGERRQATIFFSDIRGFTSISEKMSPDQVVTMLNEYFTAMVKIVYQHHGVVDKYVGDAIVAVWGVPETHGNDAFNCVRGALEMRAYLKEFNAKRKANGIFEIKIGMGVNSGPVLSGNIGSYEQKLEYTVIGDAVNQASRIEGACKAVGTDFLISEATYSLVKEFGIEVGPEIKIKAKGKTNHLVLHEVIGYKDSSGQLVTSLTPEEIEKIRNRSTEVEGEEEEKAQVASAKGPKLVEPHVGPVVPPPIPTDKPDMGKSNDPNEITWYVVHDPGSKEYQGPFSLSQISAKIAQGQFNFNVAYAFKKGDSQMTPLNQIPELERRSPSRPDITADLPSTAIRSAAQVEEWYVAGPTNQTLGPYSVEELQIALGKGNITRTTLVWKKGMANWIALHDIPDFDRRGVA